MKHGKRKNWRAALTLQWEATMALKSVNLLEFIFYHRFQILYYEDSGLYQDDGLVLLRNTNGELTDRVRKMQKSCSKKLVLRFKLRPI